MNLTTTRTLLLALTLLITAALAHGDVLTNGGAETGDLTGWTHIGCLATDDVDQSIGHVYPHQGKWFFSIRTSIGGSGSMSQTGTTGFSDIQLTLAGMVQTEDHQYGDGIGDYSLIYLTIFDAQNSPLVQEVSPVIRTQNNQWEPFELIADVPQGAHHWGVDLTGTLEEGVYINVFYDSVSLNPTPEPATLLLAAAGLPFLLKRKRNKV